MTFKRQDYVHGELKCFLAWLAAFIFLEGAWITDAVET